MIADLLTRRGTLVRRRADPTVTDIYGNPSSRETRVELVCEVQQRGRRESTDREDIGNGDWFVILPAGTEALQGDALELEDGAVLELVGPPWPARNPRTGIEHHVECTAQRTVGLEEEAAS